MKGLLVGVSVFLLLLVALPSDARASDGSTEISLSAPPRVDVDEEFMLAASLHEHAIPLALRELVFLRKTTFGELELARAATDSSGFASVTGSLPSPGTYVFAVAFAGEGTLRSSVVTSTVIVVGPPPPMPDFLAFVSAGIVVAVVVGSVWGCYAFVLTQLWEIRREGRRSASGLGGTGAKR